MKYTQIVNVFNRIHFKSINRRFPSNSIQLRTKKNVFNKLNSVFNMFDGDSFDYTLEARWFFVLSLPVSIERLCLATLKAT